MASIPHHPAKSDARAPRRRRVVDSESFLQVAPLVLLIYSFLLFPPETLMHAGSLALPLYRLMIIVTSIYVMIRISTARVPLTLADLLVGLSAVWMMISFIVYYGATEGMTRSVALVIDAFGAYLVARSCIVDVNSLRRLLIALAPGLFFVGAEMMAESLSHKLLVRPFFASIFGGLSQFSNGVASGDLALHEEVRLGLLRAFGPFSHPILAGAIMTSVFPMYYMSGLRSWPRYLGLVAAFLGLFSVSSSAFLSIALACALIGVEWGRKFFKGVSWPLISWCIVLVLMVVQIGSKHGVVPILIRYTIDPGTGFFRTLIWQYGWASIMAHPFFGIGYEEYARPEWMWSSSVDAHFLALGIRHGLITPFALLAGAIAAAVRLGRKAGVTRGADRRLMLGVNFALVTLLLLSMTVTYFGEANVWFMCIIGICASLGAKPGVRR